MGVVDVQPAVVKWIVGSSGMGRGGIAQRLRVDEAKVGSWIKTGRMNYGMVRRLAKITKRCEALFLLDTPPAEEELPDYRMMKKGAGGAVGPEDIVTIRWARYTQGVAGEMMNMLGDDTAPMFDAATADDPPEDVARREAAALGIGDGAAGRAARGGARRFYDILRESIEERNILVFQAGMDGGTVRGVSLTGAAPYAIMVNMQDTDTSKALALLHGYGHALLGKGGICREREAQGRGIAGRIEAWCDRFAASALFPRAAFEADLARLEGRDGGARAVVAGLARMFGTSGYAAAVMAAGVRTGERGRGYRAACADLANRCASAPGGRRRAGRGRRADPVLHGLSRMGRKFAGLTLESYEGGHICTRDAVDFLGMDTVYFDRLRQALAAHG